MWVLFSRKLFPVTCYVVEFVLDACPSAVYTCDSFFGALPIHYAAEQKSFPVDSLRVLLRANPSSLLQADGAGFLPLHRARQYITTDIMF